MGIIPRLDRSVCGCSLETGSMIIAWICVIIMSFELIIGAFTITYVTATIEEKIKENPLEDQPDETTILQVKIIIALMFVILTAGLIIDLLLLLGVHKRNHCLMTPWVFLSGIGNALVCIAVALNFVYAIVHPELLFESVLHIMITGLGLYCYLVVYSHYRNLLEERAMNDSRFKHIDS